MGLFPIAWDTMRQERPIVPWSRQPFCGSILRSSIAWLTAYKTFVGPLSHAECEQYWQESCRYARLLGLTDTMLPASYAAVQQYIREALASGEIAIGPAAHFIAQKVLYPSLPWLRKPLWMIVRLITVGQLPSDIRQAYGLRWSTKQRVGFRIARGIGHLLRRLFPNALGRSPLVNFARHRVQGEQDLHLCG